MSEQKFDQSVEPDTDDGRRSLKNIIIALAIVEALVLIPIVLYTVFR